MKYEIPLKIPVSNQTVSYYDLVLSNDYVLDFYVR